MVLPGFRPLGRVCIWKIYTASDGNYARRHIDFSVPPYYSLMGRVAFDVIEEQQDGSWICRRATTVPGRYGPVAIARNQVFHPRTVFGGYEDFISHLATVSVETPAIAPHEW